MDNFNYPIINNIKNELAETNHFIDDEHLVIFKYTDKVSRCKFKKGVEIVKEGQQSENIIFLVKGFLKIFRDVDGKRIFIRMMAPAEYIGLTLLVKNKNYPYSIETLEDSIVYFINKESITEDFYKNPAIMKWVINNISSTVSTLYQKVIYLRCKHMNGRIAEAILYFADNIFKCKEFKLPVTKKQLGHFANVSPENVSRIIKTFVEENIIEIKNKNIKIIDYYRLIQISKIG